MTRDKNEIVEDGADEKMLSADDKEQLAQKDEVKFIPANDRSNGDAKIEIGRIDKVCNNWNIIYCFFSLILSLLYLFQMIEQR